VRTRRVDELDVFIELPLAEDEKGERAFESAMINTSM
jgi:hypothetical protein